MSIIDSFFDSFFAPSSEEKRLRSIERQIRETRELAESVSDENFVLRSQVKGLTARVERLEQRQAERDAGGPFR